MRTKKGEREEEEGQEEQARAVCTRETAALNCTESTGRSVDRYAWDDVLVRAFLRRGLPRKMQRETPGRRRR